jgi:hypothetical protein
MWLSLVERCVRDAEAAGSNPVIPTIIFITSNIFSVTKVPEERSYQSSFFIGFVGF